MTPGPARSLRQIGVVISLTLREARSRKILWLGLGLGIAFVALYATGLFFAYQDFQQQSARMRGAAWQGELFASMFLMAGLYVVNFLIVAITALTTVGSISAEIDSSTIHAIAAKPIRRWEIVVGKWIGHALLAASIAALLTLGVLASSAAVTGYVPPRPLGALLVLVLESLVVLSLTLAGSTLFSTLANGVIVFMLYGLAFVGGWVEQIGGTMGSRTALDLGIASSLLMPSEALWRYAAGLLSDSSLMMPVSPFTATSRPSTAFVIYALVYVIGLLGAAIWGFNRRDF